MVKVKCMICGKIFTAKDAAYHEHNLWELLGGEEMTQKEQAIEKLSREIQSYDTYVDNTLELATHLYEAGYRLPPEQTDKELDPPPRFDDVYYQGLKHMNEGEQTNREAVAKLFENGLSCSDGQTHFLDESQKRYLISEILSLITPELEVMSDEEIEQAAREGLSSVPAYGSGAAEHRWAEYGAIAQAQLAKDNKALKGEK